MRLFCLLFDSHFGVLTFSQDARHDPNANLQQLNMSEMLQKENKKKRKEENVYICIYFYI